MLLNETTTRSEVVTVPSELEALVAAGGRQDGRPLVAFLKQEKLNVALVGDADSAFEEALLHRPNLILIHDDLPPAGGIELVTRLKANTRTHFLPTILFTTNDNRQQRIRAMAAGADAVFWPELDQQERRTRLWALLRSQALQRRQESRRDAQRTVITERTRWIGNFVHDLQNAVGALQANFEFLSQNAAAGSSRTEDVIDCQRETRTLLQQLSRGLRTVQDYERFQSGRVVLRNGRVDVGDLLAETREEIAWQLGGPSETRPIQIERGRDCVITGDRDLLRQALATLAAYLLRQPRTSTVSLRVHPGPPAGGTELRLTVASDGEPFVGDDRERVFEPYLRVPRRAPLAYGVGLALARSIIDLHGGRVRVGEAPGAGAAFEVELKSADPSPNHPLGQ
jgi:signal transduction histidine kinase